MREDPNVRLSFDGFKVKTGIGLGQIEGFAVRPKFDKPRVFDNAKSCSRILVRLLRPTSDKEHQSGCPRSKSSRIHEVRHRSVGVFLVPSLKLSLTGISTMKPFGNSEASDPQNIRAWTVASGTVVFITSSWPSTE